MSDIKLGHIYLREQNSVARASLIVGFDWEGDPIGMKSGLADHELRALHGHEIEKDIDAGKSKSMKHPELVKAAEKYQTALDRRQAMWDMHGKGLVKISGYVEDKIMDLSKLVYHASLEAWEDPASGKCSAFEYPEDWQPVQPEQNPAQVFFERCKGKRLIVDDHRYFIPYRMHSYTEKVALLVGREYLNGIGVMEDQEHVFIFSENYAERLAGFHPDDPDYKEEIPPDSFLSDEPKKTRKLCADDFNPHCLGALKDPGGGVWQVIGIAFGGVWLHEHLGDDRESLTGKFVTYEDIRDWQRSNATLDGWIPCVVEVES